MTELHRALQAVDAAEKKYDSDLIELRKRLQENLNRFKDLQFEIEKVPDFEKEEEMTEFENEAKEEIKELPYHGEKTSVDFQEWFKGSEATILKRESRWDIERRLPINEDSNFAELLQKTNQLSGMVLKTARKNTFLSC